MSTTEGPPPDRGKASTWTWLLPVLTFLVGCLLGGAVIAAGASGDDDGGADAEAVATPGADSQDGASPGPSPSGVRVSVPQSCLDAADNASTVSQQAEDAVAAVRDLDARRLQEVVDRFQQLQPEVERLAEQCRDTAGERLQDGSLVTPAPVATPTG